MKATIDRAAFVAALGRARGIAGGKGMPVLANDLLRVGDDALEVAATDLHVTYQGSIPATHTEPGTRLVNAALFYDVVRSMPCELVDVSLDGERLLVTTGGGGGRVLMHINSSEDRAYPDLVDPGAFAMVDVDGAALAEALRQVLPVVSRDESRPNLCAVSIETVHGVAMLTASDGRRLHRAKGPEWSLPTMLIPSRAASLVRDFLSGPGKIGVDDNAPTLLAVRNAAGDTIVLRLVDGMFPDVSAILKTPEYEATFSITEMGAAVRRVCLMADSELRTLTLAFTGSQVVLTSGETDRAREVVTVGGTHPAKTIRINAKMLSDALACAGEGAALLFGETLAPVHVVSPGFQAVIMPQRA